MLDAGEILRLFAPNGFGVPGRYKRIKDWLDGGSYVPMGVADSKSFRLKAHNPEDLTGALTDEFCGSALSAFESMIEVERGARSTRALAWPAIKAYYSSFFSAHAVTRFLGVGCTWLTSLDLKRLKTVAALHQALAGSGPRNGQWRYAISANGEISFELGDSGGGGGAHDVVWNTFSTVLDEAMTRIASSSLVVTADAQTIALFLDSLRTECKSSSPSNVRNSINYRREYGVWFPFVGFDSVCASSLSRVDSWRQGDCFSYGLGSATSDVKNMFLLSYSLGALCLSLCRASAKHFERSDKRFTNGPLKLSLLPRV